MDQRSSDRTANGVVGAECGSDAERSDGGVHHGDSENSGVLIVREGGSQARLHLPLL